MSDTKNMLKPLFLVKPQSVSRKDIIRAEKHCGICIIECSDPDASRYSEPPLGANLDEQARAALSLLRMIMASQSPDFKRSELTKFFVNALLNGSRPQSVSPVSEVKK